jgi:plastocyanin
MRTLNRKNSYILTALALLLCVTVSHAGTVTGMIKFEGKVPQMKVLDMSADEGCVCDKDNPPRAEALVLGDGNTMANVFVQVSGGLPEKDFPAPKEPAVLTQKGCIYSPHVFVVQVGQPLDILNPDGILHNVHSFSKANRAFNIAMPKFKEKITKTFDKPEKMFAFKCDIHPWMASYCVITDHPFHAVTEKDGVFKIEGLDPGTYEIEATHERLGSQTASVTVGADDTQTADFTFSRTKRK